MQNLKIKTLAAAVLLLVSASLSAQKFTHQTDVVKAVKERFEGLETYMAEFTIVSEWKDKRKIATGTAYYKKGGKVNFTFTSPEKNLIISNGKKIWIHMAHLNAVGIQDLDPSKANIYNSATYEGLVTLFSRYHYSFSQPEQPVTKGDSSWYILELKEKVASGGFSNMLVYIDPETYLIEKIEASNETGKKVKLTFKNIVLNEELPDSLFHYTLEGNTRVVENPLTTN